MQTPTPTYAEAMDRLQVIVEELESGRLDVDRMLTHVKEAEELVSFCRARLRDVSGTMDELLARMKGQ